MSAPATIGWAAEAATLTDTASLMHSKFCAGEIAPVAYETWVRENLMITLPRCTWCFGAVTPDDDFTVAREGVEHSRCGHQRQDEQELRDALRRCADDLAEVTREYREHHTSRVREHQAGALLARIQLTIAAAVGSHD